MRHFSAAYEDGSDWASDWASSEDGSESDWLSSFDVEIRPDV